MQASSLLYSKGKQLHQEALIPAHPGGVPGSGPKLQPVPLGITSSSPVAWMPPRPLPCPVRHHGDHLSHPATRLCVPELCCCWQPLPSISAGREQAPTLTPGCRHPPPATSSDRGQRGHHEDGHISTSSTDLPPSPASPAAHCLQAPKAADSPLAPGQIRGPPPTTTYGVTPSTASSSLPQSQSAAVSPPDSFLRPIHFSVSLLPSSWSNPSSFLTGTSVLIPPVYSGPSLTPGQ